MLGSRRSKDHAALVPAVLRSSWVPTVVDVSVPFSDVQKTSRATLGSTVNTCIASVLVFSGSEVDARPALLVSSFYTEWTVDASVASRVGSHGNLDTSSRRTWQSLARCLCIAVEKFFTLCHTGPVSPGVLLTGDVASFSLRDCRCIDRCGVIIHTHQVVSETTTTTITQSGEAPF